MNVQLVSEFNDILNTLDSKDKDFMQGVYLFSEKAHENQKRKSGEKYFNHPLAVGINLYKKFGDIELFAAGLLHDASEDNENIPMSEIYEKFGQNIGFLVDSVTKTTANYHGINNYYRKKIDKFLDGGLKDIRCFTLKLADREDNLKTIQNLKDNKQVRMAFETQAIFTPLEELIGYKESLSINKAQIIFNNFIKNNSISSYSELKDKLIRYTFDDFGKESFDAVYQNTHNVTWKIQSKEMLDEFLKIPNIEEKLENHSLKFGDDKKFCFQFQFKKGYVINSDIKLRIGDKYSLKNT